MVRSFYINPAGDLEFDGQNDLRMVEGDDELVQCVRDILTTNLGEWFLNLEHGFPWYMVLGEKYDRERVTEELIAAVLQEDRVQSVEEIKWEFDPKTRRLNGSFKFTKTDGQVVEGVF